MSGQIIQIRLIALAVPLLAWGVGIGVPTTPARADDCVTAPRSVAPTGSHWYYHTDRTKRRKCWFLGTLGQRGQRTAAKVASAATTVARASAVEKPAKAQPPPISSATTYEPVRQGVQDGSTAPLIPEAPAPPASAPWQTSAQAVGAGPAATIGWPDPTAVAPVQAQKPNLVLSDARADSVLPTGRAPDGSGGAARGVASTAHAPFVEASPSTRFVEILLVAALGLIVAGVLYRVVMKIGARRAADHRRSIQVRLDRRATPARVARRPATAWIPHEGEEVIDDLHPSLVPAAGEYRARRPSRADDERQNNARGKHTASQSTDEISGREDTLAQLILDLEQMLQSAKRA
jgi:hypothetical protein